MDETGGGCMNKFTSLLWAFSIVFHLVFYFYYENKSEEHRATTELIWVGISIIMARIETLEWSGI